MANIYFKNISFAHFMSYESANIALNRSGNILVGGQNNNPEDGAKSNGCGKSTIFNALSWCLTGETISGATDVTNIYTQGKTEVTVEFTYDGKEFKVTRTKNPSNLFVYIDGENKSGKGIRDTSKLLAEYLPQVTSNLLNSVIVLGQGLPQKFTNNTPSGRKDVLEKLSNSEFMIEDLKNRIAERKKALDIKKRDLEDLNLQHNTLITNHGRDIKKMEDELTLMLDQSALETGIKGCEEEAAKQEEKLQDFQAKAKEAEDNRIKNQAELDKLNNDYNEAVKNIVLTDTSAKEAEANKLRGECGSLQSQIYQLENVTDVCPTCGQKLPDVHKIDTTDLKAELAEKQMRAATLISEVGTIKQENEKKKQDCYNQFEKKIEEKRTDVSVNGSELRYFKECMTNLEDAIKQYINQKNNLQLQLDKLEESKKIRQDRIIALQAEIKDLEAKVLYNNAELNTVNERLSINAKMTTLIKRDFRGYLLNNVISFIEDRAKTYAQEVFGTDKLSFELAGNNINIAYDGKDYSCLSGGEKQKLDVIIQFAIRDMLCTFLGFSSNILVLDEITDALDSIGVSRIFNLISSNLYDVEAIYIISHHVDELEIPADDEILIIKGDDKISRIV